MDRALLHQQTGAAAAGHGSNNDAGDERAAAAEVAEVEVVGEAARRRRYGRVCLAPMEVVQLDVAAHRQIWWAPRPPQTADIADHEASAGALALP